MPGNSSIRISSGSKNSSGRVPLLMTLLQWPVKSLVCSLQVVTGEALISSVLYKSTHTVIGDAGLCSVFVQMYMEHNKEA